MTNLKLLYLDFNKLSKWEDLEAVTVLPSLMHVSFNNNACTQLPGYRHFIVSRMPHLLALDDFMVTDEERIEEVSFGKRFRALAPHMRIVIPDFLEGLSADQHLFHLDVELYKLKRLHEKNSPSIRIQSLFRGFKQRIAN